MDKGIATDPRMRELEANERYNQAAALFSRISRSLLDRHGYSCRLQGPANAWASPKDYYTGSGRWRLIAWPAKYRELQHAPLPERIGEIGSDPLETCELWLNDWRKKMGGALELDGPHVTRPPEQPSARESTIAGEMTRAVVQAAAPDGETMAQQVERMYPSGTIGSLNAIIGTCQRAIDRDGRPELSHADVVEEFLTIKSIAEHALKEID